MPRIHTSDLEDNIPDFIRQRLPKATVETAIDVGANVGWYTIQIQNAFSSAFVWSFEPVPSIHERLLQNMEIRGDLNRAQLVRSALGARSGSVLMTGIPNVTVNHIVDRETPDSIEVNIAKGDDFCRDNGIDHIDLLKVDAEGHDMNVLVGFSEMIIAGKVNFIQVEAGMSTSNKLHVPLQNYVGFLDSFGYSPVCIKNQASYDVPILTWADVLFINRKYAEIIK